jgi:hypothetical protein
MCRSWWVLIPTSFLTFSLHNFFHIEHPIFIYLNAICLLSNSDIPMSHTSFFEPRPTRVSSLRNLEFHSSSKFLIFFQNIWNLFERNSIDSLYRSHVFRPVLPNPVTQRFTLPFFLIIWAVFIFESRSSCESSHRSWMISLLASR